MIINSADTMTPKKILLKAVGQFKNSGKYFFMNGRYHLLHRKQKAPKGAPVVADKRAAGKFEPKQHFTDAEWVALKLPDSNTNAKTFNAQLEKLRAMSDAGNIAAMLGSQYGTNTYGKKLSTIANKLLKMHGSEHQVTAGQKIGQHPAISGRMPAQQAPAAPAAQVEPAKPIEPPAKPEKGVAYEIDHVEGGKGVVGTIKQTKSGKWVAGMTDTDLNQKMPDFGTYDTEEEALSHFKTGKWKVDGQPEAKAPKAKVEPKAKPLKLDLSSLTKDKLLDVIQSNLSIDEPPTVNSYDADENGGFYGVMSGGNIKDIAKLLKDAGLKLDEEGIAKGFFKVPKRPAKYFAEKEPEAAAEKPASVFIEGKNTKGVVDYYEKQAQKLNDLASAGDLDALEAFKSEGLKPNAKGKVGNTWKGKTANSKALLEMHSKAVEKLGGKPAEAKAAVEAPANKPAEKPAADAENYLDKIKNSASTSTANMYAALHVKQNGGSDKAKAEADAAVAAKATPKAAPSPAAANAPDFDAELLATTNSNAKSHNGKVAAIKAMFEAGDKEGLENYTAGKNTYGKKQIKLAAAAAAALSSGPAEDDGPKDGETKAGADGTLVFKNGRWHKQEVAEPVTPTDSQAGQWYGDVLEVKQAIKDNNVQAITNIYDVNNGYSSPGAIVTAAYAKKALDYLASKPAVAGEPKAEKPKADQAPAEKAAAKEHTKHDLPAIDNVISKMPQGLTASTGGGVAQIILDSYKDGDLKSLQNMKSGLFTPTEFGNILYQGKAVKAMQSFIDAAISELEGKTAENKAPEPAAKAPRAAKPKQANLPMPKKPKFNGDAPNAMIDSWESLVNEGEYDQVISNITQAAKNLQTGGMGLGPSEAQSAIDYGSGLVDAIYSWVAAGKVFGPAPVKPDDPNGAWIEQIGQVEAAIDSMDIEALKLLKYNSSGLYSQNGKALHHYATQGLTYLGAGATPPTKEKPVIEGVADAAKQAKAGQPVKPVLEGTVMQFYADRVETCLKTGDIDKIINVSYVTADSDDKDTKAVHEYAQQALFFLGADDKKHSIVPTKPVFTLFGWQNFVNKAETAFQNGDISALARLESTTSDIYTASAKKSNKYVNELIDYLASGKTPPKIDNGPKDGDTKPGANGMLVFKNGRWHKVDEDKPVKPELKLNTLAYHVNMVEKDADAGDIEELKLKLKMTSSLGSEEGKKAHKYTSDLIDYLSKSDKQDKPKRVILNKKAGVEGLAIPEFNGDNLKHNQLLAAMAADIKNIVMAEGKAGFKGKLVSHKNGMFSLKTGSASIKKISTFSNNKQFAKLAKFLEELKELSNNIKTTKKPSMAAKVKQEAAEAVAELEKMDSWTQTGPQDGSNEGGKFKDDEGVEWYCKFPDNSDHAKAEVLSAKLYALAGLSSQDAKLITKNGKIGIASKWTNLTKGTPAQLAALEGSQEGFAIDAWLANWDVVGTGYDNMQVGPDGKAHRVDAGGSLMYRAQGAAKEFGHSVAEIDTMRDASKNSYAAAVFGSMTKADITASVAKLNNISDDDIIELVMASGPGDANAKAALAETLIERKHDLLEKYPSKKKAPKKLDPTSLTVDPSQLTALHDFNNWNGQGKGLSSKEWVNEANHKAEQDLLAVATKGDLTALQDYEFEAIDKETGESQGLKPINQHPSQYVVGYWSDLVATLGYIANPPEALKKFKSFVATNVSKVSDFFKSKPYGVTVNKVDANSRLAFWVAIGNAKLAKNLVKKGGSFDFALHPTGVPSMSSEAKQAAHSNYKALGHGRLVKRFINGIQSSGSYNDNFRDGLLTTHDGHNAVEMVKDAYDYATEKPEGFEIYKWISFPKDMTDQLLSTPEGTVFQNPGSMCCSVSPSGTSGFANDRMRIRYAEGAKAVDSFGSGQYTSESEITTLPGQRFVLLSCKKVQCPKKGMRMELDVLMLPPDPTYVAELENLKAGNK